MIVYRFAHKDYADDLSGSGAAIFGGRWNPVGLPVVYTASSISLAMLEVLANSQSLSKLKELHLVQIQVPDIKAEELLVLPTEKLKSKWWKDYSYSQRLGDTFLKDNAFPVIQCPSSIVREEVNYLFNPRNSFCHRLSIISNESYAWDARLIKT